MKTVIATCFVCCILLFSVSALHERTLLFPFAVSPALMTCTQPPRGMPDYLQHICKVGFNRILKYCPKNNVDTELQELAAHAETRDSLIGCRCCSPELPPLQAYVMLISHQFNKMLYYVGLTLIFGMHGVFLVICMAVAAASDMASTPIAAPTCAIKQHVSPHTLLLLNYGMTTAVLGPIPQGSLEVVLVRIP